MRPATHGAQRVDRRLREIRDAYPARLTRTDLSAAARLLDTAGIVFPATSAVVVGTNGKTSTATFLARLLRAGGHVDGLTTSPHISSWGERVRICGRPSPDEELLAAVERLHLLAGRIGRPSLRLFDLLTGAAASMFASGGVDAGVFEAGIGGRRDTTRLVQAPIVVLSGIGIDHTEMLGPTESHILREKLGVAAPGSYVLTAELPEALLNLARQIATDVGFELEVVPSSSPHFLERNAELAARAAAVAGVRVTAEMVQSVLREPLSGRMDRFRWNGVEVIVDAAHNPQAWREVKPLLPVEFVSVVSASADRPVVELENVLARAREVIVTVAWSGRSYPAAALAAQLGVAGRVTIVEDPADAIRNGVEVARRESVPLVVLGSSYLLPHAYEVLSPATDPEARF